MSARPPAARRGDVVHSLHGVDRPDPYAWLADTSAPETLRYLREERAYHDAATEPLRPLAGVLTGELAARLPRTDVSAPWSLGEHAYFDHRPQDAEYARLLRTPHGAAAAPEAAEVVLDPAEFSATSGFVELGVRLVSPDERVLAYSLDLTGEEVFELRFRDLQSGEDLADRVARTYYDGAWSADSQTFFYTVPDDAYRPWQLWRHRLGTDAGDDALVLQEPDEQYFLGVRLTRSGEVIVVHLANRDTTEVWLIDAARPEWAPRCVQARRQGIEYDLEHAGGDRALIVTNDGAPEFQVMSAPLRDPLRERWTPFLESRDDERVYRVDAFADRAIVTLRRGGALRLRSVSLTDPGSDRFDIVASEAGATLALGPCTTFAATEVTVVEESYTRPRRWDAVDLRDGTRRTVVATEIDGYDPDRYATEVLTFAAGDRARVPATIVRHRDTPLDGSAPALVYGYGAYEIVADPRFDEGLASLLDRGVVFVHAHVRGGGEGGRRWWLDGRLERKQNTFGDLITVAEGLSGLVDGERIATRGRSAGGLLQGAVLGQRPDLWRAVIAEVPFVDVVTTMLDDMLPLTAIERDEWGDPRRAEDFAWMLAYSPYDNLPPAGGRPALLVTGALYDPRVRVTEPAKWVAALRASDPDWSPRCLFRCEVDEGAHSGPAGRLESLRHEAEICAWVLTALGA